MVKENQESLLNCDVQVEGLISPCSVILVGDILRILRVGSSVETRTPISGRLLESGDGRYILKAYNGSEVLGWMGGTAEYCIVGETTSISSLA
jgi:hypothetical protein